MDYYYGEPYRCVAVIAFKPATPHFVCIVQKSTDWVLYDDLNRGLATPVSDAVLRAFDAYEKTYVHVRTNGAKQPLPTCIEKIRPNKN